MWDIDGTLFSSEKIIHQIYQDVFEKTKKKYGWPKNTPDLDAILKEIGKPVKTIFMNLVPEIPEDGREFLSLQILHALVSAITFGEGHYYHGCYDTLHELSQRGYRFFAASNGRFPYVEAILRKKNIWSIFEAVDCINNININTKEDLVKSSIEKSGLITEDFVLIGDRNSDRLAAQKNNVDFIACTFGHGEPEEWEGAKYTIDTLQDLLEILP